MEKTIEFGFGIKLIEKDNLRECHSLSLNRGMPLEIIIHRMKMLLIQLEKECAQTFDQTHYKVDDK